jgi:hypothetical protein
LHQVRVVAQPGSALVWGARGRKFESCLPDNMDIKSPQIAEFAGFYIYAQLTSNGKNSFTWSSIAGPHTLRFRSNSLYPDILPPIH